MPLLVRTLVTAAGSGGEVTSGGTWPVWPGVLAIGLIVLLAGAAVMRRNAMRLRRALGERTTSRDGTVGSSE